MANYMQDVLNNLAIVVVSLVLVVRIRGLRRQWEDPTARVLALLIGSVLVLTVVGNVRVYAAIDRASGVPHLAQLVMHSAGLVVAWAIQVWILHWTYPPAQARPAARHRVWALLTTIALLTLFFLLAPIDHESPRFLDAYRHAPWMFPYYLTFLSYFGFVQLDLGRTSWRYSRTVDDRVLRPALRLITVGSVFGVLYVVNTGLFTVGERLGVAPSWPFQAVNSVVQAGAFYLVLFGATGSWWASRWSAWWRRYRQYSRLHPLWRAVRAAFPQVILDRQPAPPAVLLRLANLRTERLLYRILRLVTEINDCRRHLRPFLPADATEPAPDTPTTEATRIRAALDGVRSGATPAPTPAHWAPRDCQTVDEEIAWLVDVADAFTARAGSSSAPSPAT